MLLFYWSFYYPVRLGNGLMMDFDMTSVIVSFLLLTALLFFDILYSEVAILPEWVASRWRTFAQAALVIIRVRTLFIVAALIVRSLLFLFVI